MATTKIPAAAVLDGGIRGWRPEAEVRPCRLCGAPTRNTMYGRPLCSECRDADGLVEE